MGKYEIAVRIVDLSKKEEIEEILKDVSIKYIWSEVYGNFLLFNDKEIDDYKKFLKSNGLEIEQIHSVFGGDYDFSSPEQNTRAIIVEATKISLIKLEEIKVKNFVIHCSAGVINKNEREERIKILMDSISRILPISEKTGIKIAIENSLYPETMIGTGEEIIRIIEEFNSPYLGVCFDTGHAHTIGKFKEEFIALKDKIFTFHLHDNDGERDLHLPPIQGTIDWKWFIKELKKSNYSGQLPIEVELPKYLKWSEVVSNMKKLVENDGEGEFLYGNRIIKII